MPTLKMNSDVARSAASTIQNTHSQVSGALGSLNNSVNALQGEWIGQSADQFQSEYGQWRDTLSRLLETLQSLKSRLDAEIVDWEATASKFG